MKVKKQYEFIYLDTEKYEEISELIENAGYENLKAKKRNSNKMKDKTNEKSNSNNNLICEKCGNTLNCDKCHLIN